MGWKRRRRLPGGGGGGGSAAAAARQRIARTECAGASRASRGACPLFISVSSLSFGVGACVRCGVVGAGALRRVACASKGERQRGTGAWGRRQGGREEERAGGREGVCE